MRIKLAKQPHYLINNLTIIKDYYKAPKPLMVGDCLDVKDEIGYKLLGEYPGVLVMVECKEEGHIPKKQKAPKEAKQLKVPDINKMAEVKSNKAII